MAPAAGRDAPDASSEYVTTPGRSRNMAAIRRKDTQPEVRVRSALHTLGYRFRKDHPIRVGGKTVRPDVAFTRRRVAIFIDGCFWHSCPQHGRTPNANPGYWTPKLQSNAKRDLEQTAALTDLGWKVLRFWEHEEPGPVVAAITEELARNHTT
jgi:DNA mismatch endonuclease (patch repair protein)